MAETTFAPVQDLDVVSTAESFTREAATFDQIVSGMDLAVPGEVKETLNREYASKDPGGQDMQCLG